MDSRSTAATLRPTPRTLVILPTLNEAGNLSPLCEQILAQQPPVDIIIIDDASPDGTADLARKLMQAHPGRIQLEARSKRLGRGDAIGVGMRHAAAQNYDYCLEMDADFSHDPHDIPRFLKAIDQADLVIGSRHMDKSGVEGWGLRRKVLHWLASGYARLVLGTKLSDQTNGFRLYRVSALRDLPLESQLASGYVSQTLRAYLFQRHGRRICEIPTVFHERRSGASKMSGREAMKGSLALLWYRITH